MRDIVAMGRLTARARPRSTAGLHRLSAEEPVALFNHAVTWLRKNRVLLS
ncbi:hypothetical protein ACWIID_45735 [Streptomyces phaeochromogenes]